MMTPAVSGAVAETERRDSPLTRKKTKRPCDACRRRKVRCDRNEVPGDQCSSCVTYGLECTYLKAPEKRSTTDAYVRNLELRLEHTEKLLRTIRPDMDFSKELDGATEIDELVTMGQSRSQSAPASAGDYTPDGDDELQSSDDEFATIKLTNSLRCLSINDGTSTSFGKSSHAVLIHTAVEMKKELHEPDESDLNSTGEAAHPKGSFPPHRRPEFWTTESHWVDLKLDIPKPRYCFPDPDLLPSLVDNYFAHMNLIFPLLHRPTFEHSLADNLHLHDAGFGGVVLLVAAVGARFSSDPRVFVPGTDPTHSVGSMWFHQVRIVLRSFYTLPSLYDLQIYCLSAMFLLGIAPQSCWGIVGAGIRLSQAVGAHRKRVYGKIPTAGDELWKRVFWVLVALDWFCCSGIGRPCAVQIVDFDLEFPVECDDEYWAATKTSPAFTQPPGKPSKISFFVSYLKLNHILASALRTIYSIKKPKFSSVLVGQGWGHQILAELDSALNEWYESIPEHLRWDPHREDTEFLHQSAVLYANYYHLQIFVHRPFVSSSTKPSPLSFPSLAICMNAARSCARLTKFSKERLRPILHHLMMPMFTAGVILLFNVWGGKWARIDADPTKEMEDVHRCMSVLSMAEKSWNPAGRLWDVLYELAYIGDLPPPKRNAGHSNKRERDSDSPLSVESTSAYTSSPDAERPRLFAGSRRVSSAKKATQQQSIPRERPFPSTSDFREPFDPPDLGNLPYNAATEETVTGLGPSTVGPYEQSGASNQGHNPMHQGTRGDTTIPAEGAPADSDTVGASLFPIDPMLYGDMMFNFGYASSIGMGQQAFGDPADNGSSRNPLGQGWPGPEYQTQQQSVYSSAWHGDDGRGIVPNPDALAMWTNVPYGFEWEGWGTYTHNFSNFTRQH